MQAKLTSPRVPMPILFPRSYRLPSPHSHITRAAPGRMGSSTQDGDAVPNFHSNRHRFCASHDRSIHLLEEVGREYCSCRGLELENEKCTREHTRAGQTRRSCPRECQVGPRGFRLRGTLRVRQSVGAGIRTRSFARVSGIQGGHLKASLLAVW